MPAKSLILAWARPLLYAPATTRAGGPRRRDASTGERPALANGPLRPPLGAHRRLRREESIMNDQTRAAVDPILGRFEARHPRERARGRTRVERRAPERAPARPAPVFVGPEAPQPTLVAHADGLQETLRERAVSTDPNSVALSNEEALHTWTVLVEGRWALVDRFEKDGRRYLVARRNGLGPRRSLTKREAQVAYLAATGHAQKFIAYELGLSQPSIARILRGVLQHLGLQSRVDLVELYGHLAAMTFTAPPASAAQNS
jgi:DNA-binding CsgD family transcriptional regulator